MQVTQQNDFISHAVIGQSESVSMGMSEDAALMHILSSALYTYPKLAAVREVICNGWDGHIISGILDTPLEITLAEGQFRVRDFGPGIAHEMIGPIYGTYGNSTKRTDSTQTGGFGLGSKAPFAYVDNFEVISCHEGTKTIYRVSKSSMEKGGKPSINKIVSMPTEEHGITVTYSVKEEDMGEFMNLINEVVILGGIPAKINGKEPVEALPLLESPTGYIINSVQGTLLSRINVRYGNVVYPVPMNTGFEHEWRHVLSTMNKLWNNSNIIFMAKPDSVSIAPNRESLNFTEGTVKTLRGLLAQFSPQDVANCEKTVKQVVNHLTNKYIQNNSPTSSWAQICNYMTVETDDYRGARHVTGPYAFTVRKARLAHLMNQRETRIHGEAIFQKRFDDAVRRKAFPDMPFAKKMRKALIRHEKMTHRELRNTGQTLATGVFHKFITLPLYQYLPTVEKLDVERLFIGDNDHQWGKPELVRLKNYSVGNKRNAINVLQKRALIVRSKTAAKNFFDYGRDKDWGDGWIIYVVGNHPDRRAEAEEMFTKLGYDVSVSIPEPVARVKASDDPNYVAPERKATPKRKGYLTLSQSVHKDTFLLSTARANGSVAGLTDPIAWVILENASHYREGKIFDSFSEEACQIINKLWGDQVAVVTSVQATALIAKGIPDVKTYVKTHVDDTLSARPDFPRYLAFKAKINDRTGYHDRDLGNIMHQMLGHSDLMNELGIRFGLTAETEMLVTFFNPERRNTDFPKSNALAQKVQESPKVAEVLKKLKNSPWRKFIEMDHLGAQLSVLEPGAEGTEIPYEILRNLLK